MNSNTAPKYRPLSYQLLDLLGWFVVTFLAAGIGALASVDAPVFYQQLQLPSWAPPASVFGPVWTVLYSLMALAAWLVWREQGTTGAKTALTLYVAQLIANALWSWLFFGFHQGAWAFVCILILWGLVLATLIQFWRIKPVAGFLFVPYLLWVSFALVLNLVVWRMNPTLL